MWRDIVYLPPEWTRFVAREVERTRLIDSKELPRTLKHANQRSLPVAHCLPLADAATGENQVYIAEDIC